MSATFVECAAPPAVIAAQRQLVIRAIHQGWRPLDSGPRTIQANTALLEMGYVAAAAGLLCSWAAAMGDELLEHTQPPRSPRKPKIPASVRDVVFERDGYACRRCSSMEDLSLDHVIPSSRGGSDDESNLQTLCMRCNISKGARLPEEWL